MSDFLSNDTIARIALGRHVSRATSVTPQSTHTSYFTITGGRVEIVRLSGLVTTLTPSGTNNAKFTMYPTTGTAGDICAAADIASLEAGAQLAITGVVGDALTVIATAYGVKQATTRLWVPSGHLDFACDASKSGSISWELFYVPIDLGASVAAA